jgi:PTS hybrid protein
MTVGLVVVSHSTKLAEGVVELAAQMAPAVRLRAAGGMADGGIGTDFDRVSTAIAEADDGSGVVVLYDLGSARMIAELAAEAYPNPDLIHIAEAPVVEGSVAAAVAANSGAPLPDVLSAAESGAEESGAAESTVDDSPAVTAELTLHNAVGLHARPAAALARSIAGFDTKVTVRFGDQNADAHSVLALLALAAGHGDTIEVSASGPQAEEALRQITELAARNFDE